MCGGVLGKSHNSMDFMKQLRNPTVSERFALSVRAELKTDISENFAPTLCLSCIKIQSCGRPICLNHQLDGQNVSKVFVVNFD